MDSFFSPQPLTALWIGLAFTFTAGVVTGVTGAWLVVCKPLRRHRERGHAE